MTNRQNPGSSPNPPSPTAGKKKKAWSIRSLAYGGIFTALVLLATLIKMPFPVPQGYVHLGDGIIFIAAMVLGPFAAVPAALGSGLADFILGYAPYIPGTILIKGLMGLFAGSFLIRIQNKKIIPQAAVFFAAEMIMIGGYFLYEWVVFGVGVAVGSIVYNAFQGIAGIVIGVACVPAMIRFRNNMQAASGTDA